jgi:hypothetical protein
MKSYTIDGTRVEIDETKTYYDCTTTSLGKIDFPRLLGVLEAGTVSIDGLSDWLYLLTRWVNEAPRKRFYRGLAKKGAIMMGSENFFVDDENGDEIIDGLENTGKVAVYLRKVLFNVDKTPEVEEYASDPNPHFSMKDLLSSMIGGEKS